MTDEAQAAIEKQFLAYLARKGRVAKVIDLLDGLKKDVPEAKDIGVLELTQMIAGLSARGLVDSSQKGVVKLKSSAPAAASAQRAAPSSPSPVSRTDSGPQVVSKAAASASTSAPAPSGSDRFDPANPPEIEMPLLQELQALGGTGKITDVHARLAKRALKEGDFRLFECVSVINTLVGKGQVASSGRGVVRLTSVGRSLLSGGEPAAGDVSPAAATAVPDDSDAMSLKDIAKMYQKKINTEIMGRFDQAQSRPTPEERPSRYRFTQPSASVTVRSFEPLAEDAGIEEIVEHRQQTVRDELLTRLPHLSAKIYSVICRNVLEAIGFTRLHQDTPAAGYILQGRGPLKPVGTEDAPPMNAAFRCVAAKQAVDADLVEKFRGEITGTYDQGILISNGTFTPLAQRKSVQPGAVPIVLMDGEALVDEMIKNDIGVRSKQVILVEVDREFLK